MRAIKRLSVKRSIVRKYQKIDPCKEEEHERLQISTPTNRKMGIVDRNENEREERIQKLKEMIRSEIIDQYLPCRFKKPN